MIAKLEPNALVNRFGLSKTKNILRGLQATDQVSPLPSQSNHVAKCCFHQPLEDVMTEHKDTTSWPELAIGLYDRLTGRQADIAYAFEDFSVDIPSSTAANAEHAHWKMNGTLRIKTRDHAHAG